MKKYLTYYKYIAVVSFSSLVLFFFINLVCWTVFKINAKPNLFFSPPSHLTALKIHLGGDYKNIRAAYSDLNDSELEILLRETRSKSLIYEPYTGFKEAPQRGKYLNIDENGFRVIRNQSPWPPNPDDYVVFVFGGSTTFGVGLPDHQTIPSCLQEAMQEFFASKGSARKVSLYNFARAFYYSSQECALYEKLLRAGYVPDMAIFIDGLNEFCTAKDEPRNTERLQNVMDTKGTIMRYLIAKFVRELPVYGAFEDIRARIVEQKVALSTARGSDTDARLIQEIINRYFENKKIIEAVSSAYGVSPVFVWQPVPTYQYDLRYHLFAKGGFGRHSYSGYGYARMFEATKGKDPGNNFLWCADIQKNSKENFYHDPVHYTALMSKKISVHICNLLSDRNLISLISLISHGVRP